MSTHVQSDAKLHNTATADLIKKTIIQINKIMCLISSTPKFRNIPIGFEFVELICMRLMTERITNRWPVCMRKVAEDENSSLWFVFNRQTVSKQSFSTSPR